MVARPARARSCPLTRIRASAAPATSTVICAGTGVGAGATIGAGTVLGAGVTGAAPSPRSSNHAAVATKPTPTAPARIIQRGGAAPAGATGVATRAVPGEVSPGEVGPIAPPPLGPVRITLAPAPAPAVDSVPSRSAPITPRTSARVGRLPGSLASMRRMSSSRAAGSVTNWLGGRGTSVTCLTTMSIGESPRNGGRCATSSYSSTPRE